MLSWRFRSPFLNKIWINSIGYKNIVKLPARRAGLPGHAVASRMRANEISFFIVPLAPAYKAGLAGHLPVNKSQETPDHSWIFLSQGITFSLKFQRVCFICNAIVWS